MHINENFMQNNNTCNLKYKKKNKTYREILKLKLNYYRNTIVSH